jgi:hypothetical protein
MLVRLWTRRIAALSLGHGIAMKLQPTAPGSTTLLLWLPPRSLLVFSAEARYAWRHGIASKKGDRVHGGWLPRGRRVSVTLRRVRTCSTCLCAWPLACDSQGAELQLPTRIGAGARSEPPPSHTSEENGAPNAGRGAGGCDSTRGVELAGGAGGAGIGRQVQLLS